MERREYYWTPLFARFFGEKGFKYILYYSHVARRDFLGSDRGACVGELSHVVGSD
jgi:hypothetical protein